MAEPGFNPLEPTEAEIEDWAAAERQRRLGERTGAMGPAVLEPARTAQRYMRQAQLITEGALCLMWKWSRQGMETLIEAGREWEEEFAPRARRGMQATREQPDPRRVLLEDDAPPG